MNRMADQQEGQQKAGRNAERHGPARRPSHATTEVTARPHR